MSLLLAIKLLVYIVWVAVPPVFSMYLNPIAVRPGLETQYALSVADVSVIFVTKLGNTFAFPTAGWVAVKIPCKSSP